MEIKQQLRLSQQLVMTPQLQQAIKLLQMSQIELRDMVHDELLENPVLEDNSDVAAASIEAAEPSSAEGTAANKGEAQTSEAGAAEQKRDEIDWERYLENHSLQAPMPTVRGGADNDELPGVESTYSKAEDLTDHLLWQLRMSDFVDDEQRFAALVVGNLDDNGYLKLEGVAKENIVPRLAEESELNAEDAEEVLRLMQRFDPVGVASRDLRECLLVQAEHYGMDALVMQVLSEHLPNLEKRNYQAIARALEVPVEEIYDIAQVIMELDPRPGRNYVSESPQYITPDVYVHKVGDQYFVVANDDGMPKLKISGFYRAAMTDDAQAKEYIQSKLRSAQWLIRSIDQRRKTIVKVTECIVEKQRDFFERGIEHLHPMILRDVADTVGMHESTVSRVTSNKYVHTPRGIFELKYFFNSAIRRDNDRDIASESVKQAIRKIISEENPK
ncbi:MAG: RNA polymerase factor sigma-54, partial [Polyangiales bacterium]